MHFQAKADSLSPLHQDAKSEEQWESYKKTGLGKSKTPKWDDVDWAWIPEGCYLDKIYAVMQGFKKPIKQRDEKEQSSEAYNNNWYKTVRDNPIGLGSVWGRLTRKYNVQGIG